MLFLFVFLSTWLGKQWRARVRSAGNAQVTRPPGSSGWRSGLRNVNRATSRPLLRSLRCLAGATSATASPGHGGLRGRRELFFPWDGRPSPGRLFRPVAACHQRSSKENDGEGTFPPGSGTGYAGSPSTRPPPKATNLWRGWRQRGNPRCTTASIQTHLPQGHPRPQRHDMGASRRPLSDDGTALFLSPRQPPPPLPPRLPTSLPSAGAAGMRFAEAGSCVSPPPPQPPKRRPRPRRPVRTGVGEHGGGVRLVGVCVTDSAAGTAALPQARGGGGGARPR